MIWRMTGQSSMTCKHDTTYEAIRSQLVTGELKAGERVSEQGLAEQLGVSRSPVREAIKRLQRAGYFEQVHRYGTIVRNPGIEEVSEAYDLRGALEPYALRHSRPEQYLSHLAELRQMCTRIREIAELTGQSPDVEDRDDLVQEFFGIDERFHERLMRCSGNDRFRDLVGEARLFAQIHGVRRHSVITFETIMGVYRYHHRIVEAIAVGDMKAAADHLSDHIHMSRDGALDWLRFQQQIRSTVDEADAAFDATA